MNGMCYVCQEETNLFHEMNLLGNDGVCYIYLCHRHMRIFNNIAMTKLKVMREEYDKGEMI